MEFDKKCLKFSVKHRRNSVKKISTLSRLKGKRPFHLYLANWTHIFEGKVLFCFQETFEFLRIQNRMSRMKTCEE